MYLTKLVRTGTLNRENVAEIVGIVRTDCRYEWTRRFFICPGAINAIAYRRHVTKLHDPGRYVL